MIRYKYSFTNASMTQRRKTIIILLFLGTVLIGIRGFLQFRASLIPTIGCNGEVGSCEMVMSTLEALPPQCKKYVRSLTIQKQQGQYGGFTDTYGNMWIAGDLNEQQLRALVMHECGHVIDFFSLTGTPRGTSSPFTIRTLSTFADDPSLEFYTLSWSNPQKKLPKSKLDDFVSVYAQKDPIEDFAETYVYYLIHRKAFEERLPRSTVLRAKYNYMKKLLGTDIAIAKGNNWNNLIPGSVPGVDYAWLGLKAAAPASGADSSVIKVGSGRTM